MIQFYINSRPVPRAVARHHLEEGNPSRTSAELSAILTNAQKNNSEAMKFIASYGVSVERVEP